MLGKTASGIFWLFRYLERAENIARLIETGHRFTLTRNSGRQDEWRSILSALGMDAAYRATHQDYNATQVVDYLLRDKANPGNLRNLIDGARQNARATRTAITRELWEAVNECWINVNDALKRQVREADLPATIDLIERQTSQVRGALENTMLRNDGYNFSRVGNFIERADSMARLLDVKYYVLLPSVSFVGSSLDNIQWETILRATSAFSAYRWLNPGRTSALGIAEFLILDPRFPRSLSYCYGKLTDNLRHLAMSYDIQSASLAEAERIYRGFASLTAEAILDDGLHEFLVDFLAQNRNLAQLVEQEYRFNH
jgi:uncharacterized alpha-E superfamily protein